MTRPARNPALALRRVEEPPGRSIGCTRLHIASARSRFVASLVGGQWGSGLGRDPARAGLSTAVVDSACKRLHTGSANSTTNSGGGAPVDATIRDVASASGGSASTASRALGRPDKVDEHTRQRVLRAAEALDYQPNRAAQWLITGRTGNIGIVVPDLVNPFFSSVCLLYTSPSPRD